MCQVFLRTAPPGAPGELRALVSKKAGSLKKMRIKFCDDSTMAVTPQLHVSTNECEPDIMF